MGILKVDEDDLEAVAHDGGGGYIYHYKNKPFTGIMTVDDNSYEEEYVDGYSNGSFKIFYEGGKLKSECIKKEGNIHGTYKEYYEAGELKKLIEYDMSNIISGFEYDKSGKVIGVFPK